MIAIFAPVIAPYNPLTQTSHLFAPPSSAHWFGTDELGRDEFSRILYGARLDVPLAMLLIGASVAIGSTLGAIAGYFRGWVDGLIMRCCDLLFAFPAIILAMVVTATLGPSIRNAVFALIFIAWPWYARIVRGLVLSIGDTDYVNSRRLLGASARRALMFDVLPNIVGQILVVATLDMGGAVLLLSALSFLGLGAQPPAADWGLMVSTATENFQFWWLAVFPGLAIFTVAIGFNFIGDSLRDIFDPESSGSMHA